MIKSSVDITVKKTTNTPVLTDAIFSSRFLCTIVIDSSVFLHDPLVSVEEILLVRTPNFLDVLANALRSYFSSIIPASHSRVQTNNIPTQHNCVGYWK